MEFVVELGGGIQEIWGWYSGLSVCYLLVVSLLTNALSIVARSICLVAL